MDKFEKKILEIEVLQKVHEKITLLMNLEYIECNDGTQRPTDVKSAYRISLYNEILMVLEERI